MHVFTRWYPTSVLILWFAIFIAFFVVLPEWLIWAYIVGLPALTIYDVYQQKRTGDLQVRISSIDIALVLYCVYILLNILNNDALPLNIDVYISEMLFRIVVPFSLFWFIRVNPITSDQMKFWIYFLAGVILIETLLGFVTLLAPLSMPKAYQPRPVHLFLRATGSFVTPSTYVVTLFVGIIFVFYRVRELPPSREKLILFTVIIVGMIGIIISQNRGGWLVLPFLILFMIYLESSLWRWLLGAFVFLIFVTIILWPSFFSQSFERILEWRQVESRITMGVAGIELFFEKPILGWGYGTYDLNDWRYMRRVGSIEPTRYEISQATSHNTYLTIASETGIVGFLLYMFPTGYLLWQTFIVYTRKRTQHNWNLILLMWLLVGIINAAGQFADFRFFPFVLGYWWLALAIIANELNLHND